MENTLKLLIVEDDPAQKEMYEMVIKNVNRKSEKTKTEYRIIDNVEECLNALNEPFDGAIIDLKLASDDLEGKGNEILRDIKFKLRFPVVVYSANTHTLDPELREENEFFNVYVRTDVDFADVIKKFVSLYETGITKILGKKGLIDDYLNQIFWNYISQNIKYWVTEKDSADNPEKILLRYTISHLQEYLELSNDGSSFEKYYPVEMYIIPPIKNRLHTCDILVHNESGDYFIVLNPSCDMANGKANPITLAEIEKPDMSYVKSLKKKITSGEESIKAESIRRLGSLNSNNLDLKYHYLPRTEEFRGGYINFQKLSSVKLAEINNSYVRIASISDRFSKDITARMSHYYSRQGQPDFICDKIMESLLPEKDKNLA